MEAKVIPLPTPDVTDAATAFAALGSPQRLSVLVALVRAGPKGLSIGELGARVGVTGSTLTHHVKALVLAGLVAQEREGRVIRCSVVFGRVETLSEFLMAQCCADSAQTEDDHG